MTKRQTLLTMRAQDSSSEQLPTRVERWQAVWTALGVSRPEAGLPERLISCYSEPQRHYHTLQHLGECLSWLDCLRELAQRPAEIELALWFHDAIYEVRRRDNESRSADWAREALLRAGASIDVADRVQAMVMLRMPVATW